MLLLLAISFIFFACSTKNESEGGESSSSSKSSSSISYGSLSYSGKTYKTVKIGAQTWMAENLNHNVNSSKCYGDNDNNCNTYGRLYSWAAAMNLDTSCDNITCSELVQSKHQGICPGGWHIPSNAEWTILISNAGGNSTAGSYLKATSGWYSCGKSGSGNLYSCEDVYGFAALPGGRGSNSFYGVGNSGYWWSASESNDYLAYARLMNYNDELANPNPSLKEYLFSIRCLKDD